VSSFIFIYFYFFGFETADLLSSEQSRIIVAPMAERTFNVETPLKGFPVNFALISFPLRERAVGLY